MPPTVTRDDSSPVKVSLSELESADMSAAFGPESLGIILVDGLGAEYAELRRKVLASARVLAELPREDLEALELPETRYQTGWSRGIEKTEAGLPDTNKGSFYINCNFTRAGLDQADPETAERFPNPLYFNPNVWPQIPGFEANLKELVKLMVAVVVRVAAACDRTLLHQCGSLGSGGKTLEKTIADSDVCRGRLLHYYQAGGDWCGEHVDHSCLTVLTSALWGPAANPCSEAGLYITARDGSVVKVFIPEDCVAIQSGSALELITNGTFKAVPHRVLGDPARYRSTLAVFCQPRLEDMVGTKTFAEHAGETIRRLH